MIEIARWIWAKIFPYLQKTKEIEANHQKIIKRNQAILDKFEDGFDEYQSSLVDLLK